MEGEPEKLEIELIDAEQEQPEDVPQDEAYQAPNANADRRHTLFDSRPGSIFSDGSEQSAAEGNGRILDRLGAVKIEEESPEYEEEALHEQAPQPNAETTEAAPLAPTNDGFVKFQLIPISETPGKGAIGEVAERKLGPGDLIKIGRQVIRDGQATIKGTKKATELDIWFSSKVVSRLHAEIWTKDGQLCIKDVGSSSGTFLNKMRLSPTGKESRPYPLKQGDVIQFGVDFKGKNEDDDIYRAVVMKIGFHDQTWLKAQRANANPERFTSALKQLLAATNPYGEKNAQLDEDAGTVDCCICIGKMAPFQALFISPCSHCYHFKCVAYLIAQSPMFQCPLCRQVANLTASVSSDSLNAPEEKIVEPLPVLLNEIEGEDKNKKTRNRSNSNKYKQNLMETLGIRRSSHSQQSRSEEPAASNNSSGAAPPQHDAKSKKRSFSMKLRSFVGVRQHDKELAAVPDENVPRSVKPENDESGPSNQENQNIQPLNGAKGKEIIDKE